MSDCGPYVNMRVLRELFPDKHEVTVWRWRKAMPAPDLVVGHVELWALDTILEWTATRKLTPDPDAVTRLCEDQAGSVGTI